MSNANVLERTLITDLTKTIQERRLWWIGHVQRMKEELFPRRTLAWRLGGKRPRGRPKTTWRSTLEKYLEDGGFK